MGNKLAYSIAFTYRIFQFKKYFFFIFFFFLQSTDDNDIIFDDSPLIDADGNKIHALHKRSASDLENSENDEHWLWSHVSRIKRSISDLLQSEESSVKNSRKKRDLWDPWGFFDEKTTETPTTEKSTTEEPAPQEVKVLETTTKSSISNEQSDNTEEPLLDDENDEQDEADEHEEADEDNEIYGSGSHNFDVTPNLINSKLERFCK